MAGAMAVLRQVAYYHCGRPLRQLPRTLTSGCRILAEGQGHHLETLEATIFESVGGAEDISAGSAELAAAAASSPGRCDLRTARANVLGALDLRQGMVGLEISAGLGGRTRYLGETGTAIDPVKPMLERARLARARTPDPASIELRARHARLARELIEPDPSVIPAPAFGVERLGA